MEGVGWKGLFLWHTILWFYVWVGNEEQWNLPLMCTHSVLPSVKLRTLSWTWKQALSWLYILFENYNESHRTAPGCGRWSVSLHNLMLYWSWNSWLAQKGKQRVNFSSIWCCYIHHFAWAIGCFVDFTSFTVMFSLQFIIVFSVIWCFRLMSG